MPSMSPDRYNKLEGQKRKRTDSNYNDKHSDSASNSSPNKIMNVVDNSPTAAKSVFKVPEAKPKKIDLRMSSISPKRIRLDSSQSQTNLPPSTMKKPHSRSSSVSSIKQGDGSPSLPQTKAPHSRSGSISSLSRVARQMATSPSSHRKTPSLSSSNIKPPSVVRSNTPDTEMDDDASVTESVAGAPIRRTENDRIQYFKNQPDCGYFDEGSASCTRCNKTISLGRRSKYSVALWERHRTSCDRKPPSLSAPLSTGKTKTSSTLDADTKERKSRTIRPRKSLSERISILKEDEQAVEFDEFRVKCDNCKEWIILNKRIQYDLCHWNIHKSRCATGKPTVPSDRVAAAERSVRLVNDPQARSFSAHQVECAVCDVSITLEGDGDYNLSCWDAHKLLCSSNEQSMSNLETNSIPFPIKHPSPSSVSTDDTVVVADTTNSVPQSSQGIKRGRGDVDYNLDDEDARPNNRPRKEAYRPPIKEAPGPLGWFLLPFTSFVRGFRESLKNGSA